MPETNIRPEKPQRLEAGFVSFGILETNSPEAAADLVDALTSEVRQWARATPGFLSARIHVSVDRTAVVHRSEWATDSDYQDSFVDTARGKTLRELARLPGIVSATSVHAFPLDGLEGPEAGKEPGIVAVAVRHFANRDAVDGVMELLMSSGEWKRNFPGFISASPCVSADGTTFVNYPMWVDESAQHSWMKDPRISEGQEEIARLEAAPPEYFICTPVAYITAV
ncbi:antibiotic biosynthesis monooxygenase [Nocardiopsis ansamitocini]|uniref:ABM domain-containing protein n=1 Tax=Nocardiopsis ansamitocini TaxID=1670832 RepID=A0A9W6UHB1_9ACTN|nr:antibiotic biosynthesis monooxygenase [Nocardiopsis ansamitocini]GLU48676.1 hypothetical protein Nans01_30270 [Nocardiopsis ansamitocini]